jgi:poly-gamma-glutamate synthase PgsB/CapB
MSGGALSTLRFAGLPFHLKDGRKFGYNTGPVHRPPPERRQAIRGFATTAAFFGLLCLLFYLERRSLERQLRRIPLRIAVTGTRGKSTVTRLIAAALKEAGYTVLAKTTGSKPALILPDGREEELVRKGFPTILEQKRVLRRAADLGVRALVVEMMSIRPEFLAVESRRLLRPHVLLVTNVRLDHREEMGRTKPEIARSLASAIPPGAVVLLPEGEGTSDFEHAAASVQARIIRVGRGGESSFFDQDNSLAEALATHLGVPAEIARRGFVSARPDFGSLKAWQAELGTPPASWILVSAFAANEPESSELVLAQLRERVARGDRPLVGLLSFRPDRGDRTRQWLDAQEKGFFAGFRRVYLVGAHGHALRIKKGVEGRRVFFPLSERSPSAITDKIVSQEGRASVLVGLGNIGGIGGALVEHWQEIGRSYAV